MGGGASGVTPAFIAPIQVSEAPNSAPASLWSDRSLDEGRHCRTVLDATLEVFLGLAARRAILQCVGNEQTVARNPDVVFRSIEGGGVLLNVKSGAYHEVNSTAREIWEALETPSTTAELLVRLNDVFPEVPDLDGDVRDFLTELANRGLIVISQSHG